MEARPEFAAILAVLSEHRVSYIVVGGVAAVLEGAPISTLDIDVLVERSTENLGRLLAALEKLGALYRDPARRRIEPTLARLSNLGHQRFETRLGPVDVLGTVGHQRTYEQLHPRSRDVQLRGTVVRVLALDAIIESKEEAGRPRDHAVLPVLRETLAARQRRGEP
jgi:hypothetical protein